MSKARLKSKNILGIAEGGTGATSMGAGAVGTVFDTAGIPAGAIVESGSNANGSYVKWADGTMLQKVFYNAASVAVTTPAGALFISAGLARVNWPVAFVGAAPTVTEKLYTSSGSGWATGGSYATITQTPLYFIVEPISATRTATIDIVAWGRWK